MDTSQVLSEASDYLDLLQREQPSVVGASRLQEIEAEVRARGTYEQTYEELLHGARIAWRNSTRCVGRRYWVSLMVRDCRHLREPEEVFAALVDHVRLSTNGGAIRPMITLFAQEEPGQPSMRIWNEQLIRYAGYRQPDGSVVGDPRQVDLTNVLKRLGWPGGEGTAFDLLPIAIQMPDGKTHLFELPKDAVMEVEITHPDHPWFAEFNLRWHALPAISGMLLDVGGVRYPAAPFSGWYMLTEIAARNFADEDRYNYLPRIAERLGLDTRSKFSLWRDKALIELNVAVLSSFARAGVKMVDHHTVSRHFVEFEEKERQSGRPTYADWAWVVPPLSGSATPLFHRLYENVELKPNFYYQESPWQPVPPGERTKTSGCPFHDGPVNEELAVPGKCPVR